MRKLMLMTAFGAGYVLGAKAGRTRYEQLRSAWQKFAGNAQVQAAVGKAEEALAHEATVVKEKVASAASMAWPRGEKDQVGATSYRNGASADETGWPADSQAPYPPMG
jgi:hypothetical protein